MGDLAEHIEEVNQRVASACGRAGRSVDEVNLVVVAKKQGPDRVVEAAEAGASIIGESRVQEAIQKIPMCPGSLEWHMIGHLQTNKVRPAVQIFSMLHAVDSVRLLDAVNDACEAAGRTMPVCLEVNVSGESSKYGMKPDEVPAVLEHAVGLINVDVTGFMTIPPFSPDPEAARPYFVRLRTLRDEMREATGFELPDLSMGMSNDFETAVEEGATWIRVGSLIFGNRG